MKIRKLFLTSHSQPGLPGPSGRCAVQVVVQELRRGRGNVRILEMVSTNPALERRSRLKVARRRYVQVFFCNKTDESNGS